MQNSTKGAIRMVKRDYYLNKLIENRENDFAKIITGIRRCGKSTLIKESSKYFSLLSMFKSRRSN